MGARRSWSIFGAAAAKLAFDLETFRRTVEQWKTLAAPSTDASWLQKHAWSLHRLLRDALADAHNWSAPRPQTEA